MSITGSNNPFACEPVVFANANQIISLGTITRVGNEFTFSVGFVWKINGVTYQNTAPVVITITEASTGFQRIDNALLNTSNTIELQQGLESDTIALRPVAPETNIILTSWNISGTTIGDTDPSIVGIEFKKKIENTRYRSRLSGENVIIPFQAAGQSHYSVSNAALVSVAGFTTAALTTPMYEGQDVIFENQTGHEITLKDSFGVDTSFVIGDDLIVPNEGKLWFRFRNNELELIDKNWFEINEVATPQNLGEFIDSLDSKTDVKDTDEFVLSDSDDELKSKKTKFFDIKNKLKGYFDTLYLSLSIFNDFVTDVFSSLDNKLDKSSTPSSVYATDAEGLQVMKPLSDFTGYATQTWVTLQGYITNVITSLGYTPENIANKSSNTSLGTSNDLYPTQNAVKTYVDNGLDSKQNKIYSLKVTTPSEYVTGTVSETEILKIEIPANTFSDNDVLNIPLLIMRKVGVAASYTLRVKLSSSPTMPTGTGTETIAFMNISSTNVFTKLSRNFIINGGFLKGYPLSNSSADVVNSTVALREQAFDNTITNYLYVSVSPLSSDDSFQLIGFQINNF